MGCGTSTAQVTLPAPTNEEGKPGDEKKSSIKNDIDRSSEKHTEIPQADISNGQVDETPKTGEEGSIPLNWPKVALPDNVPKPSSLGDPLTEVWSRADEIAIDCPPNIRHTVQHITDYLKQHLSGVHLGRAIFRWITSHIIWRSGGSQEPDSVLRRGGGEDLGIAKLFAAMCGVAELNVSVVSGYVKTDAYIPGSLPDEGGDAPPNHWNHLQIGGQRFAVDCCRGAGILKDGNFEPLFNEFYWLPSPHQIIYTHFPVDAPQDCEKTYRLVEWATLPKVTPLYFESGLDIKDNLSSVYMSNNEGYLVLRFQTNPCYIANVNVIRLLVKERQDEKSLPRVAAEYLVYCKRGLGTDPLFPVIVNTTRQFKLVGPLMGELARNLPVYFHCTVKGASQVSILLGEDICALDKLKDNRTALLEEKRKIAETAAPESKPAETPPPEPASIETSAQESGPAKAAAPESAPAETAAPESSPAETAAPESAPAETAALESAPAETAAPESAPAETAAPESAPAETAAPESAPAETAAPESAPAETAAPESAPAETAAPESAPAEAVAQDSAPTETVALESAPAETVAPEPAPAETVVPESVSAETAASESVPTETAAPEPAPVETPAPESAPAKTAPLSVEAPSKKEVVVLEEEVTSEWAGSVTVRGREVFLAAFYNDGNNDYTNLVKFLTKVI